MSEVAVITGTTHGIGKVTSRELARAGKTVVMLCRDTTAARQVRDEIRRQFSDASILVVHCDLASLASVRECAKTVRRLVPTIGMLINNAGMVSWRRRVSPDGFELTFATNHLGPFLLTELLLDRIEAPGRIINVASRVHFKGDADFERVTKTAGPYNGFAAYARSKLANVMHALALARRLEGRRIAVNCLHPGVIASNLVPRWLAIVRPLIRPAMFDVERGAQTTLHLALSEEGGVMNGRYLDENSRVQPASAVANDPELQEQLWRLSEEWTGLREPVRT